MGRKDKSINTASHLGSLRIGARMRLARQNMDISLTEMARRVRYTKNYLSSIENDLRKPSLSLIETYERELGLERDELAHYLKTHSTIVDSEINSEHFVSERRCQEDRGEAPAVTGFYGRQQEIAELKRWIVDERCRMIAVLGFGGIGKTTLVASLLDQMQEEFEYIFWRSLQNAPLVESILRSCVLFLSNHEKTDLPKDLNEQYLLLIHYLQQHRCLLVLDNFESVLRSGERTGQYRKEYWEYGQLLQRIGEAGHQSCLVLTSREKPREILLLEGKVRPVRTMQMRGIEASEAIKILLNEGLSASLDLYDLINFYNGNPMALKLAIEPIRELFQGDIATFLTKKEAVVGNVDELIDEQFSRLPEIEQQTMYWLAIEREAVSPDELREDMLSPVSRVELLDVLTSLRRRFMIETKGTALFWLQPVIMEYVTDQFVKRVCEEILSETLHLFAHHMLLKAHAKEYVRKSQDRLILAPLADLLLRNLGEESLEERLRNILNSLREARPQTPNYVAGNILNLLVRLQTNLSGYDFSYLYVWQAYLQGISLHGVNFSHANLARSIFTDTFGSIFSVTLSPHGDRLAAGTANGEVRLWDTATATPMHIFRGHSQWVRSVAFSPTGHLIGSGSEDQSVRLWESDTGRCLYTLIGHRNRVYAVAFSPDGRFLASSGNDQAIRLWDVQTGECLKVLREHNSTIYAVAFSPDGRFLASGGQDALVNLWDVNTEKLVRAFHGHKGRVRTVTFSPDSDTLASGSEDFTVRLWDVNSGECFKILDKHVKQVWSIAFSAEGDIVASGSDDHTIRLWDVGTGECKKTLQEDEGHGSRVYAVAFNSSMNASGKNILASGSDDQTIRVWDADEGDCIKTLQGYSSWVHAVAFHPDGSRLVTGSEDKLVRLWDLNTRTCTRILKGHTHWVWSAAFNSAGTVLATGSEDWTLRLWDILSDEAKVLRGHNLRVYSVAFSPDGRFLASGSGDQTVKIWDASTGACIRTFEGHTDRVRSVAFCPKGYMLASGSDDHTVKLWDAMSGTSILKQMSHDEKVYSVAFSPDGRFLASGSGDQTVKIWDASTGACIRTFEDHRGSVYSVAFSPDGHFLASGGDDKSLHLWDVLSGQRVRTFNGSINYTIAFSPDGLTIASGEPDGVVRFWHTQTGTMQGMIRSDKPYEGMDITRIKGLTVGQKDMLKALGAIEQKL